MRGPKRGVPYHTIPATTAASRTLQLGSYASDCESRGRQWDYWSGVPSHTFLSEQSLDLNTGLRDKELREIRREQIDLVHKKALTGGKSKTEAGTGRVILLNETAIAAMEAHAAWYTRRFGGCRPEWFVFALPPLRW